MTQVREGLRHRPRRWLTVNVVVSMTVVAGVLAVSGLVSMSRQLTVPDPVVHQPSRWLIVLFIAMAALSDVVYVPVRHADAWEELTFVEVVVLAAVIILPPAAAIASTLIGFALVAAVMRRPLVKSLFNLGSYAVSGAALMGIYLLLVNDSGPFSLRSVLALTLAAIVFTALNLGMLSLVLLAAEDVSPWDLIREQWSLSFGMALGSVGIATVGISILQNTPVLLPFAVLPVLAMWYVYRASSAHAQARERSRWLVQLGQAVSNPAPADELIPRAAEALRKVYGADAFVVHLFNDVRYGEDLSWSPPLIPPREAVVLDAESLPATWHSGVAVRLDDQSGPGVLAIGSRTGDRWNSMVPWGRSWRMSDTDLPALVALSTAVSNAMRAGQTLSALTAETAKLQAVVDHATDGICVVDGDGEILLWSPAAASITGISHTEPPLPKIVAEITSAPSNARGHALEFERADGQLVSLQVIRVDVYGSVATSVITIRDMTRERRAERLKSDFIATISHELRTPITPIRGYADLLKRRWDRMSEEKRASVLETIEERADHLARLVDDLLMAARTETDTALRVDASSVNLVDVVADAATGFPEIDGRLTIAASPPLMVVADRTRVVQIISNLVGNALKYTPADSPIEIGFKTEAGMVLVEVTDHGPGIAADEQEKVFERFYRIEDPLTMRTGGSGLGLHISRQLARAMGGDVTLKSSPGQGSTFILRLRAEG